MESIEQLRLAFFLSIFFMCAAWEWVAPRKTLTQSKTWRWMNNVSLTALNSLLLTILFPILAVEAAIIAKGTQFGLFHFLELPNIFTILVSLVILDLAIYAQHLVFHRIPALWKLHRMHHADLDIDVTTGARFHPIEIILSMLIKIVIVMMLGIPPIAVVIFEVALNGCAMFNHSNAKLPLKFDNWLRQWLVTPDMHRVHHSKIVKETHSNFGFCLSVWDRLFGTYIAQPQLGHDKVVIGVKDIEDSKEQRLDKMITQPFRY
ncbi:sterol desaturase family protein [Vibrio maerlii]|uniref:sterol desaturase family protein n=1 Tax=Vibrio maerlii TaxID=2231648 RepID=UPI000E3E7ABA|nr:sterol desaturase family protein [Vibrio maerlii]